MHPLLYRVVRTYLWFWAGLVLRVRRPLIIGITGSVGKTTTKELIAAVLSRPEARRLIGRTWKTPHNLNDNVGVPLSVLGYSYFPTISLRGVVLFLRMPFRALSLLAFKPYADVLVLEFGAGRAGDIAYNSARAAPDVAVITAVGPAHLSVFGTVEAVAQAKGALLENVRETGLTVLGPDIPDLERLAGRSRAPVTVVDGHCETLAPAIATAVARHLGIPSEVILKAVGGFAGVGGRFTTQRVGDLVLIDDAFNANPLSMRCGLERLSRWQGRRVAILGWMGEMGPESERYHREVAAVARGSVDLLVGIGELARLYHPDHWFPTSDACAREAGSFLRSGDVVLVKGSHAVGLGAVTEAIRRFAPSASEPGDSGDPTSQTS
jgi:UDP-N-acetylmuramoyl-tripeptide--D-alanyl-D-alanine ligase